MVTRAWPDVLHPLASRKDAKCLDLNLRLAMVMERFITCVMPINRAIPKHKSYRELVNSVVAAQVVAESHKNIAGDLSLDRFRNVELRCVPSPKRKCWTV